ncbi:DUF3592 domain-containing protein [Ruminococcus sp.]|uniref:DUF3592 domain-containing protein n=1 Tax=Ruminococcus sp. TaxID=41978 RepID=UPI0025FE4040|nr:DUF3592 domain-containing protein [Ruminococcus sp.]MBQ9541881.1 hypothetical protein [Ruminococcus sp.]
MAGRKNRKTAKESSDKTVFSVIFIILVIGAFIASGAGLIIEDISLRKSCTAYAEGEVVRVEVTGPRRRRSCKTHIKANDGIFTVKDIVLAHGGYEEGEHVTIHYDPDDHSLYYVEGTSADRILSGIVLIVIGVLIILFVIWLIKAPWEKNSKK